MTTDLFTGRLVRLCAMDLEHDTESLLKWFQDSEFQQLVDWGPANLFPTRQLREWREKESEKSCEFSIHALNGANPDDGAKGMEKIIGFVGFGGINWAARDAWVGIGIGEREYWGKGYGSDAMKVLLRYGFTQLNLNRVSLSVFEYNERAIRSYEKVGFRHEGRQRQLLNRFDRRWDMLYMGILRCEWEEQERIKDL